ncbi:MAG: hypothetical protein ACMVY4_10190 [Minwuia sp.]|uniref:hypothetical protein n=1 Tax=Minwuia sp. TaxID=2493630 RepID=UPI003A89D97A
MTTAEEKQIRIEIAASGFGETVEGHGFRKVGATHWRRDGEEVSWRVALVPAGYKRSPGCFHAVMGGLVHGLDELAAKVDGKPVSSPIQGLSARAHVHRNMGADLMSEYHRESWDPFDDDLPEAILHPEHTRRKYQGKLLYRLPEGTHMEEHGEVVWYWGLAGDTATAWAFMPDGRDPGDIARRISGYFELFYASAIDRWTSFSNVYKDFYARNAPYFWPQRVRENFCAAKLAGDHAHIQSMIRSVFSQASRSVDQIYEELMASPRSPKHLLENPQLAREVFSRNRRIGALNAAKEVVEICHAIGEPVPDHAYDFGEIPKLEAKMRDAAKRIPLPDR